jgi:PadR family transcriptional regulator, regulatory protein PadR
MYMFDDKILNDLLEGWEDVYKKGQLTLWVLLAVRDSPRHTKEINDFITDATNAMFSVDSNSLYRALKRYEKAELIRYELKPGNAGPDLKVYSLTDLGGALLDQFIQRNVVSVYYDKHVIKLMKG